MNENNLPIGSVGKLTVISDSIDVHYGYSNDEVKVGEIHKGEEHFVYKIINDWHLIANNQWVLSNDKDFVFQALADISIEQPINQEETKDETKSNTIKVHEDLPDTTPNETESVSEEQENNDTKDVIEVEVEIPEEEALNNQESDKTNHSKGFFKKVFKLFGIE
jgi:hypothetical protein